MLIATPKVSVPQERRVGLTPDVAQRYLTDGHQVAIESGAGGNAGLDDDVYQEKGCEITSNPWEADAVITVGPPSPEERGLLRAGSYLIGFLAPFDDPAAIADLADTGVTALAFETLPRTTRAQSMDALTSQSSMVGYQLALHAASLLPRVFAMMVTPAGTLRPAVVMVLGCGVAGLSAISTARRLGAVVEAFDIRSEAASEVASLGAKFINVEVEQQDSSAEGGYARALSSDEIDRLIVGLATHLARADVIITTAAVPGRPAPLLVSAQTVHQMRPGAVIVDGAAERGGNCELTEAGKQIQVNGVIISGPEKVESWIATDSSRLLARNAYELWKYATASDPPPGPEDEILSGVTLTRDGQVVHPRVRELLDLPPLSNQEVTE